MPRIIMGEEYLSATEAAKEIGVSRWTFKRWVRSAQGQQGEQPVRLLIEKGNRILVAKDSIPALKRRRYLETTF